MKMARALGIVVRRDGGAGRMHLSLAEAVRQDLRPATARKLHPAGEISTCGEREPRQRGQSLAQSLGSAGHGGEQRRDDREQHADTEAQLSADVAALAHVG